MGEQARFTISLSIMAISSEAVLKVETRVLCVWRKPFGLPSVPDVKLR